MEAINFKVNEVPLSGTNLIEASAGTGKTFSIGILVLRTIVEKNIPIDNQLIVTFTNYAVAELQDRIRKFLSQAIEIASASEQELVLIADRFEQPIVEICERFEDKTELITRLRQSQLLLDEASIFTIHGFCQRMLNEFAFESGQNFQTELQADVSYLIERVTNEFWRNEITTLDKDLFESKDLKKVRAYFKEILKQGLNNTQFDVNVSSPIKDNGKISDIIECYKGYLKELETEWERLECFIAEDNTRLKVDVESNSNTRKKYSDLLGQPRLMLQVTFDYFKANKAAGYFDKFSSPYWNDVKSLVERENNLNNEKNKVIVAILYANRDYYLDVLNQSINDSGVLTFDHLILNLHRSIVAGNNKKLKELIRQKYRVAFIDEFQDTDVIQFQLFEKLFIDDQYDDDTTLFLIGDPKQSIYSFRDADVESYLHAKSKVDHIYTMNTNFRSSTRMIEAANEFFKASGDNVFGYEAEKETGIYIGYTEIQANKHNKKFLRRQEEVEETLLFCNANDAATSQTQLVETVKYLLNPEEQIQLADKEDNQLRAVRPRDIAVLTRDKYSAKAIKEKLHALGIPAVSVDDTLVTKSTEAKEMGLVLQAMLKPDIKNIRSALFLTFLNTVYKNLTAENLPVLFIDEIKAIEKFSHYHEIMLYQGFYQAFMILMEDFSVEENLSLNYASQRSLANILQLSEILHDLQYRKGLDPEELMDWLRRADSQDSEEGEYTLRIESDEEAVSIMTLHKSKGLEFPIVLIEGLKDSALKDDQLVKVKPGGHAGNNDCIRTLRHPLDLDQEGLDLWKANDRREIRRLIYVGITSAEYQCYVFYSTHWSTGFNTSPLKEMMENLGESTRVKKGFVPPFTDYAYKDILPDKKELTIKSFNPADIEPANSAWRIFSYTALRQPHSFAPAFQEHAGSDYDHFVFNLLPRGANVGTKLHDLFENIDFQTEFGTGANLSDYERRLLSLFNRKKANGEEEDYSEYIAQMLEHTLNAKIGVDGSMILLKNVLSGKRIHEMEFDFCLNQENIKPNLTPLLSEYDINLSPDLTQLQGIMNGFIDLLFEHEGRYFILDWKSNHLGYRLENYESPGLNEAMKDNQYKLQYLIYSIAVHRFLKQRLRDSYDYDVHFGGVIYVFLRGVRAGAATGIYFDRPEVGFVDKLDKIFG